MTRRIMGLGAIAVAAILAAVPARAQVADARELVAGQVATGAPATAARPDIYYFVGEAGSKLTFVPSSMSETRLILYTPTGEEMLTASGAAATLEAVLPFTDVYTLAVIRRDAEQPYTLLMTATQPTLGEAMLAFGAGYDEASGKRFRRCWVKPGVTLRMWSVDPMIPSNEKYREITLKPDREIASYTIHYSDNSSNTSAMRGRIEGDEYVRSFEWQNGEKTGSRRPFTPESFGLASFGDPPPRFTGYSCEP